MEEIFNKAIDYDSCGISYRLNYNELINGLYLLKNQFKYNSNECEKTYVCIKNLEVPNLNNYIKSYLYKRNEKYYVMDLDLNNKVLSYNQINFTNKDVNFVRENLSENKEYYNKIIKKN